MDAEIKYDKLENLPSLKDGWVRLVHRCMYKDSVNSIKEKGLIFNGKAAGEARGAYDNISSMATPYDETSFWESMRKDDFFIYDNAKYADTKIVFDMPLDEFCLLQVVGRFVHGKVDSKYIVGCVPNVNGTNKKIVMSCEEIDMAEKISKKNSPSLATPNNVDVMIAKYLGSINLDRREIVRNKLNKRMADVVEEFGFETDEFDSKILDQGKITLKDRDY